MTDMTNAPAVAADRMAAGDRWLEEAVAAFAAGDMDRAAAAGQIGNAYFTAAAAVANDDPFALLRRVQQAQRIVGVQTEQAFQAALDAANAITAHDRSKGDADATTAAR